MLSETDDAEAPLWGPEAERDDYGTSHPPAVQAVVVTQLKAVVPVVQAIPMGPPMQNYIDRGPPETVTVVMSADDYIDEVYYNGQNIRHQVRGAGDNVHTLKTFSFSPEPGGVLAIAANASKFKRIGSYGTAGFHQASFYMKCTSTNPESGWNMQISPRQSHCKVFGTGGLSAGEDLWANKWQVGSMKTRGPDVEGRPMYDPPEGWYQNDFDDTHWNAPTHNPACNGMTQVAHYSMAPGVWHELFKYNFFRIRPGGNPLQGFHPGWGCDRSGVNPIVGTRFHLRDSKPSYDLCQAEYEKLSAAEKGLYEAVPPPAPPFQPLPTPPPAGLMSAESLNGCWILSAYPWPLVLSIYCSQAVLQRDDTLAPDRLKNCGFSCCLCVIPLPLEEYRTRIPNTNRFINERAFDLNDWPFGAHTYDDPNCNKVLTTNEDCGLHVCAVRLCSTPPGVCADTAASLCGGTSTG